MEAPNANLVPIQAAPAVATTGRRIPAAVAAGGPAACFAWDEFFTGSLRNPHTRTAYCRAVQQFLAWLPAGTPLAEITPGMLGDYLDQHPGSPPTKKQHLAALRGLFDTLVRRHIMILNPALSVRAERYQVIEGKTPEITAEQARKLIATLDTSTVVGLRDRAIIGVLIYTAARAGAVAKLRLKHFTSDGTQWSLRFEEKGGKSREIPVRHDLEQFILAYLKAAGLDDGPRDSPFFRTAVRKTGQLTDASITGQDICRMVKRRLKDTSLPTRLSPHSFRVATCTDLLTHGASLEEVQYLAGHADPRTTRLYDRRQKRVTRNLVERITI